MIQFNGQKFVVALTAEVMRLVPVASQLATSDAMQMQYAINSIDSFAYPHGYEFHAINDNFIVFKLK